MQGRISDYSSLFTQVTNVRRHDPRVWEFIFANGTRILDPDNEHRKVDMEVFHPGQKPGELAASDKNSKKK